MQTAVLLGGLGVFLYGMQQMSTALAVLAKAAPPRAGVWACAAWGAAVAAVVQGSGTVVLLAMSAAQAGALSVPQAMALCWGANLGTTATGHLLRLGSSMDGLPPLLCFGGAMLFLAAKGKPKAIGQAVMALGLTLTGLRSVQTAASPVLAAPLLQRVTAGGASPLALLAAGAALAAVLQSSSAAVALLQAAATGGGLAFGAALPLVAGANLGTCTTALVAGIGFRKGGAPARRVALGHLGFNAFGAGTAVLITAAAGAGLGGTWTAWLCNCPVGFAGVARLQTAFNAVTLAMLLPWLAARDQVRGR